MNAHPHANGDDTVAIVHNGIIENFVELKEMLAEKYQVKFRSETDSEMIAHLIGIHMQDGMNLEDAVYQSSKEMRGAYAVAAVSSRDPEKIVAIRKDAPLIAGIGNGENFIASDIPALLKYCKEIYLIENGEMVVVTPDAIQIYDENREPVHREVFHQHLCVSSAHPHKSTFPPPSHRPAGHERVPHRHSPTTLCLLLPPDKDIFPAYAGFWNEILLPKEPHIQT